MSDNLEVGKNWKELVQDRNTWRQTIVNSAYINQNCCRQKEAANRRLNIIRNVCIKVYGSRIGFLIAIQELICKDSFIYKLTCVYNV